jgi:type III restriction enzyme
MELGEADTDYWITTSREALTEIQSFDTVYATRLMVDVVPNPWVARALLGDLLRDLAGKGLTPEKIDGMASYILEELRKHLLSERDRLAEAEFHAGVAAERIQFRLRADRNLWQLPYEMTTARPAGARPLRRASDEPLEFSIFAPVYEADLNPAEQEFACYLDEQAALQWWHRNVARTGYGIQGWKKNRVYPDFIFGYQRAGNRKRIAVWETKGDQLAGNLDTEYKRKLLKAMSAAYKAEHVVHAGELALVGEDGESIECEMVLMSEWRPALNKLLNSIETTTAP